MADYEEDYTNDNHDYIYEDYSRNPPDPQREEIELQTRNQKKLEDIEAGVNAIIKKPTKNLEKTNKMKTCVIIGLVTIIIGMGAYGGYFLYTQEESCEFQPLDYIALKMGYEKANREDLAGALVLSDTCGIASNYRVFIKEGQKVSTYYTANI